jgi:hypothetical protein
MCVDVTAPTEALAEIPIVDLRDSGPVGRARLASERAYALRDACISFLPRAVSPLLPAVDAITRRWLLRSCSPYTNELAAIATALGCPGIWFLNGCYQWGCTTHARLEDGVPWLLRTLDWPFPGLGRGLEVHRMRGRAGEFHNVSWPGYVGALTAMAAGRFAAAVNQAPLWRRTRHPWLRPYDMTLNALGTWRIRHIPPDHLLREVFETCRDFDEARRLLETTPISRPAIFTLVGCAPAERCVIERTVDGFSSRIDNTAAANDWLQSVPQWEARVSADVMFTRSYEESAANSRSRREQLSAWRDPFAANAFQWVTSPVLNRYTRLAVELCPARATLRAIGYEAEDGGELPRPATRVCELSDFSDRRVRLA